MSDCQLQFDMLNSQRLTGLSRVALTSTDQTDTTGDRSLLRFERSPAFLIGLLVWLGFNFTGRGNGALTIRLFHDVPGF